MKVDVLLGLQWGDEGKGKVVDEDLMPVIRLNLKDRNMFFVPFPPGYFKGTK